MISFKKVRFSNFLSFGNSITEVNLLKARKTLIVGKNGSGKCLDPWTKIKVKTKDKRTEELLMAFLVEKKEIPAKKSMVITLQEITEFYGAFPECIGLVDVESADGFSTIEYASVTARNSPVWELYLENDMHIKGSPDHLVKTPAGFVKLKNISNGGVCLTVDGEKQVIYCKSITKKEGRKDLYDIQVDGQEYYADGILVHNSSLVDVITFALFSKPFRKINRGGLVNSINKRDLLVELEFSIKDNDYLLIRGQNPGRFEIYINGNLVPQDASNKDYQKYLENDILKLNYRTFTQIVVLGSSNYVQFMKLSTSAKREIIEDILDISVFSRMNDILKTLIKEKNSSLNNLIKDKELRKTQYTFMFDKSTKTNESKDKRVSLKKDEMISLEIDVAQLESKRCEISEKIQNIESSDTTTKKKNKLSGFKSGINKNKKQVNDEIDFYGENDTCPKCKKVLDDDFKHERISFLETKRIEFDKAMEEIDSALKAVGQKLKSISLEKNKNDLIKRQILNLDSEIKSLKSMIAFRKDDINQIESEEYELISPVELENLKNLVKEVDVKIKEKYHELHVMKLGLGILKDTGAKTSIIKFYLPLINKTVNDFLERFDFNVLFMFDENFDEQIKARHIDSFRYGNFSEGERKKIDLALMFTWREIAKKKNSASTNLLFFDEVLDSSMDAAGLDNFMQVINEYDSESNLFVISHREGVETGFESVITAKKTNNFSSYDFS